MLSLTGLFNAVPTLGQPAERPFGVLLVDSMFVFQEPPPSESCHASSLVCLPRNKILAVWFGGKYESSPDVRIWGAFFRKGKWSRPVELADGQQPDGRRFACWNPVVFRNEAGLLFLHYKVGTSPRTWWAEMKTSGDEGKTWSAAVRLPEGFLGPIKNKPLQISKNEIIYGSSVESADGKRWTTHLEHSDASGQHWRATALDCDTFGAIQPTLLRYGHDTLQLLCRSRQNAVAQSWSFDGGHHWQPLTATTLPNPNSGIDAVSLRNGTQLLVYNPLLSGREWWEGRSSLRVAASTDGKYWRDVFVLEQHISGEFSYPAIIEDGKGMVHITYTYNRKKMKHVRLKVR